MTSQPFMQYEAGGTTFRWHGGEYISVGYMQAQGAAGIGGDDFHAYDVINVWDYQAGMPRLPRSLDAFKDACDEWLVRQDDES